jgi:hypothetical protein
MLVLVGKPQVQKIQIVSPGDGFGADVDASKELDTDTVVQEVAIPPLDIFLARINFWPGPVFVKFSFLCKYGGCYPDLLSLGGC